MAALSFPSDLLDPGALVGAAMAPVRGAVEGRLRQAFDSNRFPQERYDQPPGDPGWFGPDSVAWWAHSDLSMIVGGFGSLMLQALHPLAMAGVAEHSDFKERPAERLSRTASFVVATTYGDTATAQRLCSIVARTHRRITGTAPDGRRYDASDPALLRWVHVAEVASFAAANARYGARRMTPGEQDRYFDEMAVVAEALGATEVPRSRAEVDAYFAEVSPELVGAAQAQDTLRFLARPPEGDAAARSVSGMFSAAAWGLLPPWAHRLYGRPGPGPVEAGTVAAATRVLLAGMRAASGENPVLVEATARARARPDGVPVAWSQTAPLSG
ncbi:MAG: oxygenase MpaB family protein [Microthrixaceae bacterium]